MFFLHKPTLNRITLTCCVPVRASHTVFPGLLFPSRGTAPLRPMSAQSQRHGGFGVRRLAAAFTPECAATSSAGRVFESCRSFLGLSWQRCLTMYLRVPHPRFVRVGSDDQAPHTLFSSFCFCSRRFPKRRFCHVLPKPVIPTGAARLYSSAPHFGASGRVVEGSLR
jgi:hypothetical protein